MKVARQYRFISIMLAWMLTGLFVLVATGWFTYELLFVISFAGLLVVAELTAPIHVRPPWRRQLRWIVFVSLIGFIGLLAQRTYAILEVA